MICKRCGKEFEREPFYLMLCGECLDEAHDLIVEKMILTDEELKEFMANYRIQR